MEATFKGFSRPISQEEMVRISRRFEKVSNSLYCAKGFQLYSDKFVSWIGSKTSRKTGKHCNYYAFDRKDFSELNQILNRIYLKEKKLKETLKVSKIDEIEDLRRYVIFDLTNGENTQDQNFLNLNNALKFRLDLSRKNVDEKLLVRGGGSDSFNLNYCAELWLDEFKALVTEKNFKDIDPFIIKNYITFNIAYQYVYECSSVKKDFSVNEFLNFIQNVNALTFGLDFSSYRNTTAMITEGNWTPVDQEEIYKKMEILVDWYLHDKESLKLHPLEAAAILNCEIIRTQAFADGNHRTARLITSEVFIRADIPPIAINLAQRSEYNEATNKAIETHELDDLIDFFYREVYKNATKIESKLDNMTQNKLDEVFEFEK